MEQMVAEIMQRKAYRGIDVRKIPGDVLDRVLEAATLAPSCANNQSWRFIAVTDSAVLNEVKKSFSGGNYWAKTAPAVVLVCTNPDDDCRLSEKRDYALFDTGMATMNLMLQSVHEGLRTHPIAGFNPVAVKQTIGIPDETILVTLIILGYPGSDSDLSDKHAKSEHAERERKPIEQIVAYDQWPASWSE